MRLSFNHLIVGLMTLAFVLMLFFNLADVQSGYANCLDIQALKKAELTTAETTYARFDTTLEILGLEKTPQLEAIRDSNIQFARENFTPDSCKKFYIPFWNESIDERPPPQPILTTTNP